MRTLKLAKGTIKRIHVQRHNLSNNTKNDTHLPVFSVQTSKGVKHGHRFKVLDDDGKVVLEGVYAPKPLNCGARVWLETRLAVEVIDDEEVEKEPETLAEGPPVSSKEEVIYFSSVVFTD